MKKMVAAGWGTPRQVLEACTHTFEHGVLMRKHRARQRTLTRRTVPQTALA
jgi:hypothetical protein